MDDGKFLFIVCFIVLAIYLALQFSGQACFFLELKSGTLTYVRDPVSDKVYDIIVNEGAEWVCSDNG